MYTPGKADAAPNAPSAEPATAPTHPGDAPAHDADSRVTDAASRVVRDGYRIVEENLRRGRQVASELRGARREVQDFTARLDPQRLLGGWTQALLDPALAEQLRGVARGLLSNLSAALPAATVGTAPGAPAVGTPVPVSARTPLPLHPQERAEYSAAPGRVLKLKSTGPGEWLADLELDGKVRRVQIRAVDGEL